MASCWRVAAALALATWLHPAPAGVSLAVAPTSLRVDGEGAFTSLVVGNRGDEATGIEAEIVRLRWVDGAERYEPTQDFTVTPPSFRLAAGADRVLRLRFNGKLGDAEAVYRLFVRQLPEQGADAAVRMLISHGVPLYVAPTQARPALSLGDGPTSATLANSGNVTVTVRSISPCAGPSLEVARRLFPGQTIPLTLTSQSSCLPVAQTDRGALSVGR